MVKKILSGIVTLTISAMILTGCGASGSAEGNAENGGGQKISVVGSTTVAVPMESLIAKYKEKNKDANLELQGVGSSAGIKAAIDGTANIGMSSRNLKEEEKTAGLVETIIAYDGVAAIVHPSNAVADLTKQQVKDIFEGKITNWKDVGGADKEIVVVTREQGSGTRDAFEELLKIQEERDGKKLSTIISSALVAEGTGTMMATVSSKEGAIGFVSLGFVKDTVKAISIEGVAPTVETVKSGTFAVSRPLLVLTKKDIDKNSQAFIDFILGDEGQKIVSEHYIPVKN